MGILATANKFLALTGLAAAPSPQQSQSLVVRETKGPEQRSDYIDGQPVSGSRHYGFEYLDEQRRGWFRIGAVDRLYGRG